ncbi:metallophosphoesterase [Dysgonomonas sp. 216]|uniref:metallophosphoesterase n=1 Tax=Dysgonomonas sp. 216 TaxID=2302934 RepID=UPI0013CF85CE|nr:metallophosphoesterase [Dysgonomonas sp. 216]NDW17316.1 metallophosphoesterase [Dysgonomonas sp. 216]
MKFIFIFILVIFLLANFYVFQRIWVLIPPSKIGYGILIAFAILVNISLFIFFIFGNQLSMGIASFFYTVGTSWIFIFLYLFILTLIKDLIRLTRLVPSDLFTHYTRENWVGLCFAIVFVFLLMFCGYLKYRWKVKVELPVSVEKVMEKRDSLRIVAISDLHLGYSIGVPELQEWIEFINAEEPDIVLIAGDIIDNSIRPLKEQNMAQYFKHIKAPLGVYACVGNHEYISGYKESAEFMNAAGIRLLQDEVALVDSSFYVIGRDDRMNPDRKPISELVAGIDRSKPIILLDHQPYHLEEAEANKIDLQISGHTHKGQVWPISLITNMLYEKSHGYLKKGDTNIYVSSGIGIWGGKFRIGTQSEYVVINMKQE